MSYFADDDRNVDHGCMNCGRRDALGYQVRSCRSCGYPLCESCAVEWRCIECHELDTPIEEEEELDDEADELDGDGDA